MRVSSSTSTTISDEELVMYNVKELNRVLKSKGDDYDAFDVNNCAGDDVADFDDDTDDTDYAVDEDDAD